MKIGRGLSIMVLVLCAFLMVCCAAQTNTDTAEEFLTNYYTSDYEGRYSSASDAQAYGETYDAIFGALVSEDVLESLKANRTPYKYDKLCAEKGVETVVKEVALEGGGETYTYTVTVDLNGESVDFSGQIELDRDGKVSYFHEISNSLAE